MSVYKQLNAVSDDDSVNNLVNTMKNKRTKLIKNDDKLCDKNKDDLVMNADSLFNIDPGAVAQAREERKAV